MRAFICYHCKGEFRTETTQEQKEDEAVNNFGAMPDDAVSLCDKCYSDVMQQLSSPL